MDMGKSTSLAEIGRVYKEAFRAEAARQERLARCRTNFGEFVKTYFADSPLLQDETPPFHRELISIIGDKAHPEWRYTDRTTGAVVQREGLIVAAPRGHAKTTLLTLLYPLWLMLFRREPFIIIVGNAASSRVENVTDIRTELESNELIKADFGPLEGASLGLKWSQSDIVMALCDPYDGSIQHTSRVLAQSPQSKIHGKKHRGHRPSAIILDDAENDEMVRNAESIQKLWDWIQQAAIPALRPKDAMFVMVGTVLSYASVLNQLLDPKYAKIYIQRRYQAYWTDAQGVRQYLWPARFTPEKLEAERERLGEKAFSQEFLNLPGDPSTAPFRPEDVRWYRGHDLERRSQHWYYQGQKLRIIQAVDPAISEKKQADFFAHMTVGVTTESKPQDRKVLVLYPYQDRLTFPQQVDRVIQQANAYAPSLVGIEDVAYQDALRQQIQAVPAGARLRIKSIKHVRGRTDKHTRITSLGMPLRAGQLYLRAAESAALGQVDETKQVRVHPW